MPLLLNHILRGRWLLIVLIAGCGLLLWATLLHDVSGAAEVAAKNLTRDVDPVVISGKQIPTMNNRPIDQLRLYALKNGALQPVPFQIDQRDPNGELVFPLGDQPTADTDAGRFDANDELVFMAMDAGDHAAKPPLPDNCRQAVLITLRDPQTGRQAYVYLLAFDDPPPPAKTDYVSWDAAGRNIISQMY
ncbi:MAG: hypothetical protein ACTSXZ_11640, partial [Alphaproteobacteria bacterium]